MIQKRCINAIGKNERFMTDVYSIIFKKFFPTLLGSCKVIFITVDAYSIRSEPLYSYTIVHYASFIPNLLSVSFVCSYIIFMPCSPSILVTSRVVTLCGKMSHVTMLQISYCADSISHSAGVICSFLMKVIIQYRLLSPPRLITQET